MSRRITLAAPLLTALVLTACNDDGRTLAPAPTVPVSQATTTTAPGAVQLTLSSAAFDDGGFLDPAFTCDGVDVSPPLEVTGVPAGTVELALVMVDTTVDRRVHWVLSGIPASVTKIESGLIPPEARSARGDGGVEGWEGPCPPRGDQPHAYEFVVHALAEPSGLAPGVDGRRAVELLEQASVGSDSLVGFYERQDG